MNKAELINAIAETSGMTKVASKKALDATIKSITKALANGEKVGLVGFGTFTVADRAARNLQLVPVAVHRAQLGAVGQCAAAGRRASGFAGVRGT